MSPAGLAQSPSSSSIPARTPSGRQTPHQNGVSDRPPASESSYYEMVENRSEGQSSIASDSVTNTIFASEYANFELPALQVHGNLDDSDRLEPVQEDDPASFELVAPAQGIREEYSLEKRSQSLFSRDHLQIIFADPALLFKFTAFLSTHRPQSVPLLVYYLDALKAIRAINYANAVCEALDPIDGHEFTSQLVKPLVNTVLEQKANNAFDALVREELPAYITHSYIQVVSLTISKRITGSLAPHLQAASDGLAEVFCLTDPSRLDNPIVFASEEFHRTTQYGMTYVLGRNCRFLQGPWTNPLSVRRLRESIAAGKHHQEVFLNYRRDGSPFMNLLMCAPLCDSRGKVRYFIGAQVDVSGLVKECTEMQSLQKLLEMQARGEDPPPIHKPSLEKNDELRELGEMLNQGELATVRKYGGRMHRETAEDDADSIGAQTPQPRLLIKEPDMVNMGPVDRASGRLSGIYQHYLLVRPYPALRILFASPSQRVPGILQSPFMNKIGGSDRVREELTSAMAEGRGVTAKVRWVSKAGEEGRSRWIHCTPLIGINGHIGVWMVVIVDDEGDGSARRWRQAPPVPASPSRSQTPARERSRRVPGVPGAEARGMGNTTLRNGYVNGINGVNGVNGQIYREEGLRESVRSGSESLSSLRIG